MAGFALSVALGACGGSGTAGDTGDDGPGDVELPERASENFIPPYKSCAADDSFCFWDANGGAVPEGERFVDHGDCPTVRTQGIPWTVPVRDAVDTEPRLEDPAYAAEYEWVTAQVEATGCACCHDSDSGSANVFDVSQGPAWVTAMTNRGLMYGAGLLDTTPLGAFPPDDNHGFDRYTTVFPTTDVERMQAFFLGELEHRGVTQEEIDNTPPLGGPVAENLSEETQPCLDGVGVDESGVIHWPGGTVRYAWVLDADAGNPGVPPNLDRPAGTLWHAAVDYREDPLQPGGLVVSATPTGAEQVVPPPGEPAPQLEVGETYKLFLQPDHGEYRLTNCTFEYPVTAP